MNAVQVIHSNGPHKSHRPPLNQKERNLVVNCRRGKRGFFQLLPPLKLLGLVEFEGPTGDATNPS